jgi:hypothetical protein
LGVTPFEWPTDAKAQFEAAYATFQQMAVIVAA